MPKILIFEDDKLLADMYVTKFNMEGFIAKAFYDGSNAVDRILAEKPDFIIMSVLMPKKDGFEATQQLKGDSRTKDIPLAFLTTLGQPEDIEEGMGLGAIDYWVKSQFMPGEIVNKVRKHLHLPIPPEKPVPLPGEVWYGSSEDDLPPAKPKAWWQKLFS